MSNTAVRVERLKHVQAELQSKGLSDARRSALAAERDRLLGDAAVRLAWQTTHGASGTEGGGANGAGPAAPAAAPPI